MRFLPILMKINVYKALILVGIGALLYKSVIITKVEKWDPATKRESRLYIRPEKNTTIVYPGSNVISPRESPNILCFVHSAPRNFKHRETVRKTWMTGLDSSRDFVVIFLMGREEKSPNISTALMTEIHTYGDILIEDFVDSYNNLTLKSIFMLKFIIQYELRPKVLIKTDDDSYLNQRAIKNEINLNITAITGSLFDKAEPIRFAFIYTSSAKWVCPTWMYPQDFFPNYLSGMGYFIPGFAISKLYTAALYTPLIHLEDVYITGILAEAISLKRNNCQHFKSAVKDPCRASMNMVIYHGLSPKRMSTLHELITVGHSDDCWHSSFL